MNPTVLGENQYISGDKLRGKIVACVVIVVVTLVLNTGITLIHTRESLAARMVLNILLDVIAGWFVVWQLDRFILPHSRVLRLYKKSGTIVSGTVEKISQTTERYYGFDCWEISVDGHRLFVIDNDTIFLACNSFL